MRDEQGCRKYDEGLRTAEETTTQLHPNTVPLRDEGHDQQTDLPLFHPRPEIDRARIGEKPAELLKPL
jgi:hypothetical protein